MWSFNASEDIDLFSDVLDKEGRTPQIINGEIKEALHLFVPQINGDELVHARLAHHGGYELGCDAASLAHLAVPAVR